MVLMLAGAIFKAIPACAEDAFPFGFEMTLDAARQPGSKRIPTLDIGESGEATLQYLVRRRVGRGVARGHVGECTDDIARRRFAAAGVPAELDDLRQHLAIPVGGRVLLLPTCGVSCLDDRVTQAA